MNRTKGRASPSGRASRASHDTFWSKAIVGPDDACWPWQRSLRGGYGVYWSGHKNVAAHRHAIIIDGREIPEGMVVDHTCRNRACVNPSHLRVVDRCTNVHENSEAVAKHKAEQTHCIHGHPLFGANLKIRRDGRRRCLECVRLTNQRATEKRNAQEA